MSVSDENEKVFIGTFDFYDMEVGIVLNTVTKEAGSGLWLTPQSEDSERPGRERIGFLLKCSS